MSKYFWLLFLGVVGFVGWTYHSTPAYLLTQTEKAQRIVFLDHKGVPIRAYAPGEKYDWVTLAEIPVELRQLFLLAEDKDFYRHKGVDVTSAFRSLWLNLKAFSIRSGASTITQQVHRLSFSTPRSWWGKVITMLGAMKLEQNYSKEDILQYYLNLVPLGHEVSGVKMASEVFFGKDLSLLNLSEMAALAVLPRAPSVLLRESHRSSLMKQKNRLLARYAQSGLDQEVIELEKKVVVKIQRGRVDRENYHFLRKLEAVPNLSRFVENGKVRTTLDLSLQRETSEIMAQQLERLHERNVTHAATVVMEAATGNVLVYLGSQDFSHADGGQFDALSVRRQPGSALKPITYALALQHGHELSDVLPDIPSYYKTGLGQFLPRNYDKNFSGPRLMRESLANSLNLPAVALADELGVTAIHRFMRELGLPLQQEAHHYGVGITLGNVEVTPVDLLSTYSAFANGSERVLPKFFPTAETERFQTPLTERAAFLISDVLSDRVARREAFGENNPFDLPFRFSVKTGTSTDFRDNWAVGYNQKYVIVVWVGNMNQKPMKEVSGITGAGPILSQVATALMRQQYLGTPTAPENLKRLSVCALSGLRPGKFCAHTKLEYHQTVREEECSYHREVTVRNCHAPDDEQKIVVAFLPERYQAFVHERPDWSVAGQVNEICLEESPRIQLPAAPDAKPSIERPLPNSIYALDPNLPPNLQRLKLELSHFTGVKDVRWKVDGKELPLKGSTIDWPMERGKHAFEAEVEFEGGKVERTQALDVTVL